MSVTVTINDRRLLALPEGVPLLSALNANHVFLPSACGGRGACGLCRVTVHGGAALPFSPAELKKLSAAERQHGVHLACQLEVRDGLQIWIPDELLRVSLFEVEVAALRDLTHDIKEVTLQLLTPPSIDFKAGQYVQLRAPEGPRRKRNVWRAYSIASPPSQKTRIQLQVRLVPNGLVSVFVHQELRTGDRLQITGPWGEFYLRENASELLLVAGGVGMAPIRAMLLDLLEKKSTRSIRYFFGAVSAADLFLMDEMRALERELPHFQFVPALSAPRPEDAWTGERGLITEVLERRLETDSQAEAYLCGSPAMIEACVAVLLRKGIPDSRIFYDKFA